MARPKNDKLKHEILEAARVSFRARGYDATSYASVAEACGISRNLVQYHFPKKQLLAIGFMERLLEESRIALDVDADALRGNLADIYAIGVCYFEFLLQEGAYREFLADLIRNRDLTEDVLSFNGSWALAQLGKGAFESSDARVVRAVVVQMGGFYELLYHCLQRDERIDIAFELRLVMAAFAQALGYDQAELKRLLPREAVAPARMKAAVRKVNAVLL